MPKKKKRKKESIIGNTKNINNELSTNKILLKSLKEILVRSQFSDLTKKEIIKKIDEFEEPDIRVALIGITSSGKSSLLNVLLGTGEDILKEQSIVTTNTIVYCSKSDEPELKIVFNNNDKKIYKGKDVNFDLVKNYSSEDENDNNKLSVSYIEIGLPSFLLPKGIIVIDSPGLNAYKHEDHQDITLRELLPHADIVLYLTPINTNLKQADLEPLKKIMDDDQSVIFIQTSKDSIRNSNYSNGEIIKKEDKLNDYKEEQLKELKKVGIKNKIVLQIETTNAEKYWDKSGIKEVVSDIKNLSGNSEIGLKKRIVRIVNKTKKYHEELSNYLQSLKSEKSLKTNISNKELSILKISNLFDQKEFNSKVEKWKNDIDQHFILENIKEKLKYLSDKKFEEKVNEIPIELRNLKIKFLDRIDSYENKLKEILISNKIEFNKENLRKTENLLDTIPKIEIKSKEEIEYHKRSIFNLKRYRFWIKGKERTHYKEIKNVLDKNRYYQDLNYTLKIYFHPVINHLYWFIEKINKVYISAITKKLEEENQILNELKSSFRDSEVKYNHSYDISKDLTNILDEFKLNNSLDNTFKAKYPENKKLKDSIDPPKYNQRELDLFGKLYLRVRENLFNTEYFNQINKITNNKDRLILLIGNEREKKTDFLSKLFKLDKNDISNLPLPFSIGNKSINKIKNFKNKNLPDLGISFVVFDVKENFFKEEYIDELFHNADIIHLMVEDLNQVGSAATELFENNIFIGYIKKYLNKVLFVFPRANFFGGV